MVNIKDLLDKGTRFHDEGKFQEAITIFKQILSLEPKNVDALIKIGLSYRHLENYDVANRILSKKGKKKIGS
jgi:TolA-binding protein